MNDYYNVPQEDSDAAKKYREYIENTHVTPEWYLIERAFKDGICHAKGIQYDFLSDIDKDFIRSTVNDIKERHKILEDYGK